MTRLMLNRLRECSQFAVYIYAKGTMQKLEKLGYVEPAISHFKYEGYRITAAGINYLKQNGELY
jgi:hypothetical protein